MPKRIKTKRARATTRRAKAPAKRPKRKQMAVRAGLFLLGLALVPICAVFTATIARLLGVIPWASGPEITRSAWAFAIGFTLWVSLYVTMPRPIRTYVLAHELTHALWGALMGARVSNMKLSKSGGSVSLSKSNVLVTLAPYFFPLYTVLAIICYCVLAIFIDVSACELFWLAFVGFTWSFHVTFTISTLLEHQSDIKEYGSVFSYSLIYLLNVIGIGLWVVAVSAPTMGDFAGYIAGDACMAWNFAMKIVLSLQ
jgi:hypothetical protein